MFGVKSPGRLPPSTQKYVISKANRLRFHRATAPTKHAASHRCSGRLHWNVQMPWTIEIIHHQASARMSAAARTTATGSTQLSGMRRAASSASGMTPAITTNGQACSAESMAGQIFSYRPARRDPLSPREYQRRAPLRSEPAPQSETTSPHGGEGDQRALTAIGMPPNGRRVIEGAALTSPVRKSRKLGRMVASAMVASIIAYELPTHRRGPLLNGK